MDPVSSLASAYGYALANPVLYVDPDGRMPWWCLLIPKRWRHHFKACATSGSITLPGPARIYGLCKQGARSCERANFCKEMFEHWMNDVPDKLLDEFLSYMRYDKDDFGVVNLDQFTRSCEAWLARKSKEPSFAQQLEDWCKLSVHYSKPR